MLLDILDDRRNEAEAQRGPPHPQTQESPRSWAQMAARGSPSPPPAYGAPAPQVATGPQALPQPIDTKKARTLTLRLEDEAEKAKARSYTSEQLVEAFRGLRHSQTQHIVAAK